MTDLVDARLAVGRLRESWPWLADMTVPGPTSPPGEHLVDPRQAVAEAAQHRRDRAAKHAALVDGIVPPGPHADAARVGPIAARAQVAARIKTLTEDVWTVVHGRAPVWAFYNPRQRQLRQRCLRCAGEGWLPAPALPPDWPEDCHAPQAQRCPVCAGAGDTPTGAVCVACGSPAACGCDHDDVYVLLGLAMVDDLLPHLDADAVAAAVRTLEVADRTVRRAARAAEVRVVIKAPCPACGRRELVAECADPDETRWSIRCDSRLCTCTGSSCGCGRPVRTSTSRPQRHWWPAQEFEDLARALGVDVGMEIRSRAPWLRGRRAGTGRRS